MANLNNIRLTDLQITEIDFLESYYRNADLEMLARSLESDILLGKSSLFPILPISPDIGTFNQIIRVTINRTVNEDNSNARLTKIEELKYPPERVKAKLYYNRASYKTQSIFYGGFGNFQGLFENPPKEGDIITVSYWQQKESIKISYAKIFHSTSVIDQNKGFEKDWKHYQVQISCLDSKTKDAVDKLFSLITFFFNRVVNPNNQIEYLFSAYIANNIFEMEHNPKIEAILYPSAPMGSIATNIAIIPTVFDSKFNFAKAEEYLVLQNSTDKYQWICQKTGIAYPLNIETLRWD